MGLGAADELNLGHDAGAIIIDSFEKKPGNGSRLWGRALGDDLAFDGAAVKVSPTGAGAVDPYFGSGCVVEGSVGGLKDPLRDVRDQLTFVDLNAFAGNSEDGVLAWGRVRGVLTLSGGDDGKGCCEEYAEAVSSLHPQKFTPFALQ